MMPDRGVQGSEFGDVWFPVEGIRWYIDFCARAGSSRYGPQRLGIRIAPWWAKHRVVSVRFRSEDPLKEGPDVPGVFTVFYARPGQHLGPYHWKSVPMTRGERWALGSGE